MIKNFHKKQSVYVKALSQTPIEEPCSLWYNTIDLIKFTQEEK